MQITHHTGHSKSSQHDVNSPPKLLEYQPVDEANDLSVRQRLVFNGSNKIGSSLSMCCGYIPLRRVLFLGRFARPTSDLYNPAKTLWKVKSTHLTWWVASLWNEPMKRRHLLRWPEMKKRRISEIEPKRLIAEKSQWFGFSLVKGYLHA